MKKLLGLVLGIGFTIFVVGCNSSPPASDLLPGSPDPPSSALLPNLSDSRYLLKSERLDDHISERCYRISYGGTEQGDEVCINVIVFPTLAEAEQVFSVQRRIKGWELLGTPSIGDEAHEFTSIFCTGTAPRLQCGYSHYLSVRVDRVLLRILGKGEEFSTSLADARASAPFPFFSETANLQASAFLNSWSSTDALRRKR